MMIIMSTLSTFIIVVVAYICFILNKGGNTVHRFFYIDVSFYKDYLLDKNSVLNKIYLSNKCNCEVPHIGICCQCFVALCGMFFVSIISLVLYYIYDRLTFFLLLNIGILICVLLTFVVFDVYVTDLVKKYKEEEESMPEEEWLAIRKEIEEEWPGFWDKQQ